MSPQPNEHLALHSLASGLPMLHAALPRDTTPRPPGWLRRAWSAWRLRRLMRVRARY